MVCMDYTTFQVFVTTLNDQLQLTNSLLPGISLVTGMKCDLCTSNLDVIIDGVHAIFIVYVSPTHVPLNATADAMASKDMAGSGSAAVFPDRSGLVSISDSPVWCAVYNW